MTVQLYCRKCDGLNEFPYNWIEEGDTCKFCGATNLWRTENEPKVVYELSANDRRLLRSLRIAAE